MLRTDLRVVELPAENAAELRLPVAYRGALVKDCTARIARRRELLTGIHPGLERVIDPGNSSSLILPARYVTPNQIRRAGAGRIAESPRRRGVRRPTAQVLAAKARLKALEAEIAALVDVHPDAALIASPPGTGAALTAEFLAVVGDIARFDSGDALAAAAGLAPIPTQSGNVRRLHGATGGDRALKRVFYQSAFCALQPDPASRAFYDRERAEGKRHHQALIALARRRVNVLFAMLRDRQPYRARTKLHLVARLQH
jgi:transposase